MSKELFWLTATIILTGVMWLPYLIDRIMIRGLWSALDNPKPGDIPQSPWAMRLFFAHQNAVENLVLFIPLVLVLDSMGVATPLTAMACAVFFWSRLAYAIVFALGIPVLRTLAFTAGWLACAVLALAIFRVV